MTCADFDDLLGDLNDPKKVLHRNPLQCQKAVLKKHGPYYLKSPNREVGDLTFCPTCGRCWKVIEKHYYVKTPSRPSHYEIKWERFTEGDVDPRKEKK